MHSVMRMRLLLKPLVADPFSLPRQTPGKNRSPNTQGGASQCFVSSNYTPSEVDSLTNEVKIRIKELVNLGVSPQFSRNRQQVSGSNRTSQLIDEAWET